MWDINRKDLVYVPVPTAKLLWYDLHVRETQREEGKLRTTNILVEVIVEGVAEGKTWSCGMEYDYANEEAFYCRPLRLPDGSRMEVPPAAANVNIAFLPPMSGLALKCTPYFGQKFGS